MTSKSTVHSSPCSSKSGRLSTTSAGTFSQEMSPMEQDAGEQDAGVIKMGRKLFSPMTLGGKRDTPKTAKKNHLEGKRIKIHQIKEVLLNMEPENHPFDRKKLCIFQTSNLHVSLPNVSFHGCTTPRGY